MARLACVKASIGGAGQVRGTVRPSGWAEKRRLNFRNVMGTSLYLREHHFPNVYSGVVH
jgi:hypothetical protein